MSLLALAQTSEAKIVYTPAHTKIPEPPRFQSVQIHLDLSHDGVSDFFFSNFFGGSAPNSYAFLDAKPDALGNRVLGNGLASVLPAGVKVDFNNSFSTAAWPDGEPLKGIRRLSQANGPTRERV